MTEDIDIEQCAGTYKKLVEARKEINHRIERLRDVLKEHVKGNEQTPIGRFTIIYKQFDAEKMWTKSDFEKKYGKDWVQKHRTYEPRTRMTVKDAE